MRGKSVGEIPGPLSATEISANPPSFTCVDNQDFRTGLIGLRDGLDGVQEQVDKYLRDLHSVRLHRRKVGVGAKKYGDAVFPSFEASKLQRLNYDFVQVDRFALRLAHLDKLADPSKDLGDTNRLGGNLFQAHFGRADREFALAQSSQAPVSVVGDDAQRLMDLVSQISNHFTQHAQPRGMLELKIHLADPFFRIVMLRAIDNECHALPRVVFQKSDADHDGNSLAILSEVLFLPGRWRSLSQ